jgi:hypothetical protein
VFTLLTWRTAKNATNGAKLSHESLKSWTKQVVAAGKLGQTAAPLNNDDTGGFSPDKELP